MGYSCQRSVVKPVKTKTMLTIPAVVGPPHADLHVDRPKYVIGTSQVTKNIHWEWENISSVLATAETCIDTPAVDEDVIDGIEPATINQHDQDASSLLDSFDLFYIAAAAKGFKDRDNGYGVIGDHVSAFLQRCAAAMEDLLIRVQGMEN